MAKVITTIKKTGPFFHVDPAKTFRANCDTMFAAIAREGESDIKAQAEPHRLTGHYIAGVQGRSRRLDGAPFKNPGATVSMIDPYPWRGHTREKGAASAVVVRFFRTGASAEGYRAGAWYLGGKLAMPWFRRTRSRIRSVMKFNRAELLKGLVE